MFSTHSNSTFDKPGERFAYDKSTGALYFDADGGGASYTHQLVANLASLPAISATDLFFVT